MIRVLVWAISSIRRIGLERLVSADPRMQLLESASRVPDLRSALRELAPDVVLLDGVNVTRWLSGVPGDRVLVLLEDVERVEVRRLLQAGVRGVLIAEAEAAEILSSIVAIREGLAVLSPEILETLLPVASEQTERDELAIDEALTERETQVLSLLAEGAGNKEIAAKLHVSEHTVKFHVSSILAKLGAATRTEAVSRGYRKGLILM